MPSWLPYVAPLALFLILTTIEGQPSLAGHYPLVYFIKMVGGLMLAFRRYYPEARPGGTGLALAAVLGVVLLFVWIYGDAYTKHFAFLGPRTGYDPLLHISNAHQRILFYVIRFAGLVVVVPFMEELFYRSFLLRFVTDPEDFQRAPIGKFSPMAIGVNVVLMALSHPEWLVAGVFSAAMCGLLWRTKNVFACVLAHGTTNLLLGVYILNTHDWHFW